MQAPKAVRNSGLIHSVRILTECQTYSVTIITKVKNYVEFSLAQYAAINIKQPSASHHLLVGLPLLLILAMSLGFVAMHPDGASQAHAKTNDNAAQPANHPHTAPASLTVIPTATLMPVQTNQSTASSSTQPAGTTGKGHGASPQNSPQNNGNGVIDGVEKATGPILH